MAFPSDLEIARKATLKPLGEIAGSMGLPTEFMQPYGDDVAKIKLEAIEALKDRPKAKYVVVTAVTPTPLGEGKTTTTVGLGQAMSHIGKKATMFSRMVSVMAANAVSRSATWVSLKSHWPFIRPRAL